MIKLIARIKQIIVVQTKKKILIISIIAAVLIIVAIVVIVVVVTKDNGDSSLEEEGENIYYLSNAKFTDDLKSKFIADLKFKNLFGFLDLKI